MGCSACRSIFGVCNELLPENIRVGDLERGRMADVRRLVMFFILTFASLGIYAALVVYFPIGDFVNIPRANVGSITTREPLAAVLLALAGILLHAIYIIATRICWRSKLQVNLTPLIWGYSLAAGLLLILIWPITSTDIFDYVFRARMAAHYGANPYIDLPNRYSNDPLFKYLGWPNAPSAYGPLWELMSARLSVIGGLSVWRNVIVHKIVALAMYLLCGVAIVKTARAEGRTDTLLGSMIWLWSPLALWEIVAIGHNDGFLVLSIVLALWATAKGKHWWAAVALVIGALFKFLPAILLPLVVVYGLRQRSSWLARLRFVAAVGSMALVLIVLSYAPYWQGFQTLYNIGVREKFLNAAPLALVTYTLSHWWPIDTVRPIVSSIGTGLLALGLLWQMWQIWRHGRDLWTASFGLLVWYLTFASQWFQPWYILWLLALIAIRPRQRTWGWVETWAISGQASYLLQYFILSWLGWPGNQLPAQIIYFVLIFLPPFIVWSIGRRPNRPPVSEYQPPSQFSTAQ